MMRPLSSQGATRRTALLAVSVRRHWLMVLLLAAGLVLRILVQVAYRPALFYIDSIKYLLGAYPGNDPPGYQVIVQPLLHIVNPAVVAAGQHLLGLGMAIALYLVLRRRGVPGWLSALAVAPVLLDGYQLQMEQLIMPDTGFEALVVAGLVLLLWNPRPRPWMVVAAGLALGASATFRQVGEILILPALLYALIVIPGARRRLGQALLLCAAFAVPILLASFKNYTSIGQFSLAPYAPSTIYGRVAEVADCGRLSLPGYERPLCPTASQKRLGPDGLDHDLQSPVKTYHPPPSMANHNVMTDFARQVVMQQPGSVAAAIGGDALKLFALRRVTFPGDTPISRWQFQPEYPQHPPYITIRGGQVVFASRTPTGGGKVLGTGAQFGGGGPVVVKPLASFLRGYQLGGGYTPGPVLAFATLAGLAGSLSLLWRRVRRRGPVRQAALG
ncbi:MAG: phospholipid carrier-dependent glycosyltransferase, partial [Actinobacteria bacterium]|nr:phospholipid carrier-dependent glycosyltransferase [Actinomycetota bacterium]